MAQADKTVEELAADAFAQADKPHKGASDDNPTHHAYSLQLLAMLRDDLGNGIDLVATEGALWFWNGACWAELSLPRAEVYIGERINGKGCRRKGDYSAIARHAYDVAYQPDYFAAAAVGLQTPRGFYSVANGALEFQPGANPQHLLRWVTGIEPDDRPTPAFDMLISGALANPDPEIASQQKRLLQEIIGAAVTGMAHKLERAFLFIGMGGGGKSTVLRITAALFPPELVCAVSPFDWTEEYQRAMLANKLLNIVGELPPDRPMPQIFKTVLGRDPITARMPYKPPFLFRPTPIHLFSANGYPASRDQSSGYWRRWGCIGFDNPVPASEREPDLDRVIIGNELPGVLRWALEGARRVAGAGTYSASRRSEELLTQWRQRSDSVAEFMADADVVESVDYGSVPRARLYEVFRDWCRASSRKPMGKAAFFERLASLGYRLKAVNGARVVEGVGLVPPGAVA